MKTRIALTLILAGCLQPVDVGYDESSPIPDDAGFGGGAGGGFGGGPACDVEHAIFPLRCGLAGCHDPVYAQNGLDLVSPGVANRIRFSSGKCVGLPLWRLIPAKLSPTPPCGAQMPVGSTLLGHELDCLRQYCDNLSHP